ncbi:hypothetical protein ACS0TY_022536 [Phlomoides rotata]
MDGESGICQLGPFGNSCGQYWDGKGHSNIVQIFISHQELINSFQYQYVDENGKLMLSELHGHLHGNNFDVVELNYPEEYITWIRGYTKWNKEKLCSITFGTNLGEYPFGTFEVRDKKFSVNLGENRQFYGFHGYGCNAIGVYMKPNMTLNLAVNEELSYYFRRPRFED